MIYVLGHNYAQTDVDSIISSIILAEILKEKGYTAKPVIINPNAIGQESKDIINRIGELSLPKLVAVEEVITYEIALVDHNNPVESYGVHPDSKTPYGVPLITKTPLLCIDHHIDSGYPAKIKIIERVGSTCTILAEIVKGNNIELPDIYAKSLVYGIACDTKGLKSRKTSQRDYKAISYLYKHYKIDVSLEKIIENVSTFTDVLNMDTKRILRNSLKEYNNGDIGIASIEVLNDDYKIKMEEIMKEASHTKYPLYVLMVFRQHKGETLVYYFDKKYHKFPEMERYDGLISRAQNLVPYILEKIS